MSDGINHTTQLQSRQAPPSQRGDLCQTQRSELTQGINSGDRSINQKALLRGASQPDDINTGSRVKKTWAHAS